ncbi:MrcB family domain-containing protein [Deinococcus kurensis]|uniref:MrcB family domain-containing protein n=1 Tax=Deinococcus kurensis TaxID=2662757 RepID=UPI002367659E|nr:DUF3578 domain-containing protein [Deinococcus kurensis]
MGTCEAAGSPGRKRHTQCYLITHGSVVRSSGPTYLQTLSALKGYIVKGSAGKGQWASVPWLAFLDSRITKTTEQGQYVVYLFAPSRREIYLSLNQGATEMFQEHGRKHGLQVLRERAQHMRGLIAIADGTKITNKISLGANGQLPQGYEAGHSIGYCYHADELPSTEELERDLRHLLALYRDVVETVDFGDDNADKESHSDMQNVAEKIKERKRYVVHKKLERRRDVAKKVREKQGCICKACRIDLTQVYGTLAAEFIEVHHLRPLSSLDLGEVVEYDLSVDYAVLCANCHRMIHRLSDLSDLDLLIETIEKYRIGA